jgi:hypothetical protein
MHIGQIDWKNIKVLDVLQGCGQAAILEVESSTNPSKLKELFEYRLAICRDCPLGQVNGINCYRNENYTIDHADTGEQTMGCSCLFRCKAALANQSCPAAKWKAVDLDR